MLQDVKTATGIPIEETQWVGTPPAETYGIWLDDVDADGPDFEIRIFTHNITLELYEPKQDPEAERAVEAWLNSLGLKWTKQSRYWLRESKRYQVIYEFSYIEKN